MRLGTTPRHTFTLPFDTSLITELKVTYTQNKKIILEKYLADCKVEENSVSLTLTQEETFLFVEGTTIDIQVRVLTDSGDALTSDIYTVSAKKCLDREVLE